jgi:hypothetical protein
MSQVVSVCTADAEWPRLVGRANVWKTGPERCEKRGERRKAEELRKHLMFNYYSTKSFADLGAEEHARTATTPKSPPHWQYFLAVSQ